MLRYDIIEVLIICLLPLPSNDNRAFDSDDTYCNKRILSHVHRANNVDTNQTPMLLLSDLGKRCLTPCVQLYVEFTP